MPARDSRSMIIFGEGLRRAFESILEQPICDEKLLEIALRENPFNHGRFNQTMASSDRFGRLVRCSIAVMGAPCKAPKKQAGHYHLKIKDPPDNYRGRPIQEGGRP